MGYTLNLEISEELYQSLHKIAEQTGETVEALAGRWLADKVATSQKDPLEPWIGRFTSNVPIPADLIIWEAPPAQNLAENTPDFSPEEETADEFDALIHELRQPPRI